MDRSRKPQRPQDVSATVTSVNIKILRWKGIARRRFNEGGITDQAVFDAYWPQILTKFFYAETARTSRAFGWLSEDRDN